MNTSAYSADLPGGAGAHSRYQRGHDAPHLLPEGRRITPAADGQVVGAAELTDEDREWARRAVASLPPLTDQERTSRISGNVLGKR